MMERSAHWSTVARQMRGSAASRGATLVEYALVFALVTVVAIGAIQFLDRQSRAEIDNQAACVSDRPAPGDCGYAPIPTDITHPDPGFSPPTSAPPNPLELPTLTVEVDPTELEGELWILRMDAELERPVASDPPVPPVPVPGITVQAVVRGHNGDGNWAELGVFFCQTSGAGTCSESFALGSDIVESQVRVVNVSSNPPPLGLPISTPTLIRPTP